MEPEVGKQYPIDGYFDFTLEVISVIDGMKTVTGKLFRTLPAVSTIVIPQTEAGKYAYAVLPDGGELNIRPMAKLTILNGQYAVGRVQNITVKIG